MGPFAESYGRSRVQDPQAVIDGQISMTCVQFDGEFEVHGKGVSAAQPADFHAEVLGHLPHERVASPRRGMDAR